MTTRATPDAPDLYSAPLAEQVQAFIDQHRQMLAASLDGLSEEEVRARLVPSKTTLLGLVKHAVFVERVWFEEAFTGRSREELGLQPGPDESFDLAPEDTVESVLTEYHQVCERSRRAIQGISPNHVVSGNRRGRLTLRWIQLHVLRELAQHCGHAEILREQILAARPPEDPASSPQAVSQTGRRAT